MQVVCINRVEHFIHQATLHKQDFSADFRLDEAITTYQEILKFFVDFELLDDASSRYQEFQLFIKNNSELIKDASTLPEMDEEGQQVAILIRSIQLEVNKRRYDQVVKWMIELHDLTVHLKKGRKLRDCEE